MNDLLLPLIITARELISRGEFEKALDSLSMQLSGHPLENEYLNLLKSFYTLIECICKVHVRDYCALVCPFRLECGRESPQELRIRHNYVIVSYLEFLDKLNAYIFTERREEQKLVNGRRHLYMIVDGNPRLLQMAERLYKLLVEAGYKVYWRQKDQRVLDYAAEKKSLNMLETSDFVLLFVSGNRLIFAETETELAYLQQLRKRQSELKVIPFFYAPLRAHNEPSFQGSYPKKVRKYLGRGRGFVWHYQSDEQEWMKQIQDQIAYEEYGSFGAAEPPTSWLHAWLRKVGVGIIIFCFVLGFRFSLLRRGERMIPFPHTNALQPVRPNHLLDSTSDGISLAPLVFEPDQRLACNEQPAQPAGVGEAIKIEKASAWSGHQYSDASFFKRPETEVFQASLYSFRKLALSSEGSHALVLTDHEQLWLYELGESKPNLKHHITQRIISPIIHLVLSPTGSEFISIHESGKGYLWRMNRDASVSPEQIAGIHLGTAREAYISFSPQGQYFAIIEASTPTGTMNLWKVPSQDEGLAEPLLQEQHSYVTTGCFFEKQGNLQFAAAGEKGQVLLWNVHSLAQGTSKRAKRAMAERIPAPEKLGVSSMTYLAAADALLVGTEDSYLYTVKLADHRVSLAADLLAYAEVDGRLRGTRAVSVLQANPAGKYIQFSLAHEQAVYVYRADPISAEKRGKITKLALTHALAKITAHLHTGGKEILSYAGGAYLFKWRAGIEDPQPYLTLPKPAFIASTHVPGILRTTVHIQRDRHAWVDSTGKVFVRVTSDTLGLDPKEHTPLEGYPVEISFDASAKHLLLGSRRGEIQIYQVSDQKIKPKYVFKLPTQNHEILAMSFGKSWKVLHLLFENGSLVQYRLRHNHLVPFLDVKDEKTLWQRKLLKSVGPLQEACYFDQGKGLVYRYQDKVSLYHSAGAYEKPQEWQKNDSTLHAMLPSAPLGKPYEWLAPSVKYDSMRESWKALIEW